MLVLNSEKVTSVPKSDLYSLEDAANKLTEQFKKKVRKHNISYLIQYGRIDKYEYNNQLFVNIKEVERYYNKLFFNKKKEWDTSVGHKLDWELSFDHLSEKERTKHVHRLHPYKGRFIPQLVEYFLKKYFKVGDIVLDPFMGSATTLVQATEMGINSIGIDISSFDRLLAEAKLQEYDIPSLKKAFFSMARETEAFSKELINSAYAMRLQEIDKLIEFYNKKYFNLDYRRSLQLKTVNEKEYTAPIMQRFYEEYKRIDCKYPIKIESSKFKGKSFLSKWYSPIIREEMWFYLNLINKLDDEKIKKLAMIILSRTARSTRATTHFDLATLKKPVFKPYYCFKHKRICKPVNTIIKHLKRYTKDTVKRVEEFSKLRTDAHYLIINGDSRNVNIEDKLREDKVFYNVYKERKIAGIFTSPPYLGQINYHDQHAYAYELFDLPRLDNFEIGAKFNGTSLKAQQSYIEGISQTLINIEKYLSDDAKIFIVVNDKKELYPEIFRRSNLKVIKEFKRPVLCRTERDRNPYYESIFELRANS